MSHRCDSSRRQLSKSNLISKVMTLLETEGTGKRTDGCSCRAAPWKPFSPKFTDLKQDAAARWHRLPLMYCRACTHTHTHVYNPSGHPSGPASHPAAISPTTPPCPCWLPCLIYEFLLACSPLRGQVCCQSGWHIVFHRTNQQTALWWVSTLVVKVTFDGWEGYGSECWGDF